MKKWLHTLLFSIISATVLCAQPQYITVTLAGNGFPGVAGNGGSARQARLSAVEFVCLDKVGNIYIGTPGGAGHIRKVDARTGIITTVAGGGSAAATSVGVPATTIMINPTSIYCDMSGNIYVATATQIKKIDAITNIITNVAGTGVSGFSGDGGPAVSAQFADIEGICLDHSDNIYVADSRNQRIRKINAASGVVTTIAGTGTAGSTGDGGPATAATISYPKEICINRAGDIYIYAEKIRKITASTGIISMFAGGGITLFDCPASSCLLGPVSGMCHDGADNLYFNEFSCSLRRVDETKDSVYAVAGNFFIESFRNDTSSLYAWMNFNFGICADMDKNLYIADKSNFRVRKVIQLSNTPSFAFGKGQYVTLCPGSTVPVDSLLWITDLDSGQVETWKILSAPVNGILSGFPTTALSNGIHETVKPSGLRYTASSTFYLGPDSFLVQVSDGARYDTIMIFVNIQTPSAGSISGLSDYCPGQADSLLPPSFGGTWSAVNPAVTIGSASGVVTATFAGVDTIMYNITGACPSVTSKVVTVHALPDPGFITGSDTVCLHGAVLLLPSVMGGTWSSGSTSVAIVDSIGIVSGISLGTAAVSYAVQNAWCTAYTAMPVTVFAPDAGIISGPANVCPGAYITLVNTTAAGTWSNATSAASVGVTGIVRGIATGPDTIFYSVTAGPACTSRAEYPLSVTTGMLPDPGVITGAAYVCPGTPVTLVTTGSSGYWSAANSNAVITGGVVAGIMPETMDTVYYTSVNACGWLTASKIISIKSLPDAGAISGVGEVCKSNSVLFSGSVTGGIWSSVGTNADVSPAGVVVGKYEGVETIYYSVTNECGTDVASRDILVVNCNTEDITETMEEHSITLFPNPASSTLILNFRALQKVSEFTLTDMAGRVVFRRPLHTLQGSNTICIDITALSNGIYKATVAGDTVLYTEKLIISR